MAEKKSKVKGKKVMDSCCAPTCIGDYKPRLYLDLQDKDVAQIKGLTVGQKVQLLVEGTIKGLEQRERQDGDKKEKTGSIQLEGYEIDVLGDEDNEFKELADDE